ncbi:MAG: hypothetical protein ACOC9J_00865, partial [Persicimonas sp.]
MRGQRSDKSRGTGGGPLESQELESLFERGYNHASKRFLAEKWGLSPDSEEVDVAARLTDPDIVGERLEGVTELQ